TTVASGICIFAADPSDDPDDGTTLAVLPGEAYTLTQVLPPSSGVLALPTGADAVVHGWGADPVTAPDLGTPTADGDQLPDDVVVRFAPRATPAVTGRGVSTTGSVVFYDPLATVSSGQPATVVVPPVAAAADATAPAVPVVPVAADAPAVPAATTTA
ncbi:hypothetical protein, partial [Curtobacterium sp. P97]|uniref:hypothetical protein n=1 Tax=Curtobacterium sp. P97 TaxID=2939562 RepID=UPI00203E1DCE